MTSDPGSRTVRYTVKMQCERVEAMFIGVWKRGGDQWEGREGRREGEDEGEMYETAERNTIEKAGWPCLDKNNGWKSCHQTGC